MTSNVTDTVVTTGQAKTTFVGNGVYLRNGRHSKRRRVSHLKPMLIDAGLGSLAVVLAFVLRSYIFAGGETEPTPRQTLDWFIAAGYVGVVLLYAFLTVTVCRAFGLYGVPLSRFSVDEVLVVAKAVSLVSLLVMAFLYLSSNDDVSRLIIVLSAPVTSMFIVVAHYTRRRAAEKRNGDRHDRRNALIVGAGHIGQALAAHLRAHPCLGYRVKGFLDDGLETSMVGKLPVLGDLGALKKAVHTHFIDTVFVTLASHRALVKQLALEAPEHKISVKLVPELYDGIGWHAPLEYVGDFPVMVLHAEEDRSVERAIKRLLDVFVTASGLVAVAPLMAAVAIAIKLDSNGPILYATTRVGKKGELFKCLKFRTMVADAEARLSGLLHKNERDEILFKIADDPRVTRLGRFLRRFSLDELPQLINVLKGEMSLVGPRPPLVNEYERYKTEHLRRLAITPGLTGLWQVTARQNPSFQRYLECDLDYIENWSLLLDVKLLLRTIPVVLRGTGQ